MIGLLNRRWRSLWRDPYDSVRETVVDCFVQWWLSGALSSIRCFAIGSLWDSDGRRLGLPQIEGIDSGLWAVNSIHVGFRGQRAVGRYLQRQLQVVKRSGIR